MTEKDYLLLLKKLIKSKRIICGFNENAYGEAIITTAIPKYYNEEQVTYEEQKTLNYNDYITSQISKK